MTTHSRTKEIVMSRVHAVHAMRPFVSTSALCVVLALVSVYAVSRAVWVEMVLRNMPDITNVSAVVSFFTYAFLHTGFVVQAFSVLALVSAFFLIRESLRSLVFLAPSRT
jgi:predicted exporter